MIESRNVQLLSLHKRVGDSASLPDITNSHTVRGNCVSYVTVQDLRKRFACN